MALFRRGIVVTTGATAAKGAARGIRSGSQGIRTRVSRSLIIGLREDLRRGCDSTDPRTKSALQALKHADAAADQAELSTTNQDRARHMKAMNDFLREASKLYEGMIRARDTLSRELGPDIANIERQVKRIPRSGPIKRRLKEARHAIARGNGPAARRDVEEAKKLLASL